MAEPDPEHAPEGGGQPPRPAAGRWSPQDVRLWIITVTATLAANIATVIFVGGAVLFLRYEQNGAPNHHLTAGWWVVTVLFLLGALAAAAVFILIERSAIRRGSAFLGPTILRIWVGFWLLIAFISFLVIVGAAAGIK